MKNYGKRKIPRNQQEFRDLIGPLYYGGKYSESIDILISYWKRKGRSYSASIDILPGLFAAFHFFIHLSVWEGLKGSLEKFGWSVGSVCFDNVPYSEGKVYSPLS